MLIAIRITNPVYEIRSRFGIEIKNLFIKTPIIIMHEIKTNNKLGGLKKESMFNSCVNDANLVGIRNKENKISG